ncbi:MAG TPA: portal protein [Xylella sp.]
MKTEAPLAEMRSRYQLASDYCSDLYSKASDDIRFVTVPGHQWDSELKRRRKHRPSYEFPKLRLHTQQVINEMRQQRPAGKVRGLEESDRGLAELMQGLCRNIESASNADHAYDIAYEKAVKGGFGVFRITTDYFNQDDFEQDIRIKAVRNPFSVKFDPAAVEIDRRDANFVFVEELIPRTAFERRFPKASVTDFDDDSTCFPWRDADQIRIAEYWWKQPQPRELLALSDGRVVFADEIAGNAGLPVDEAKAFLDAAGITVTRTRLVDSERVMMRLTNGHEWLTDPYEFPGKFIPIIPVWGNIENIDGTDYWSGMVRFSKDQQRLHNAHRSALVEAVAKAPKAPFVLDPLWIKGYEPMWQAANSEDFPYLPAHIMANGGDRPQRAEQAQVPEALIRLAGMDNDDVKASTGLYDASLGARSNETSGVAINSRKQQGAIATFNYVDNMAYAIRYAYEILVDMIPRVYDTPRVVRVLGEDGGEKWKRLYQQVFDQETGRTVVLNDISKGKYDVVVTVGPSYATQRMEAADALVQLAGQLGSAAPMIGPLLSYASLCNMDLPGLEETLTAFRKLLVGQGLLPPKEGDPPPGPPPPDPMQVAQLKKISADTHLADAPGLRCCSRFGQDSH